MTTLVDKDIKKLIEEKKIFSEVEIEQDQIQPSSIDLRLGDKAYVIPSSFLPINQKVGDFIRDVSYEVLPLYDGQVLYPGNVYIVPLLETVNLHKNICAHSNPKSSSGRVDLFVRLIADNVSHYDFLPCGYSGNLYAEIIPQSFPVKVSEGITLMQLRLFRQDTKNLTNTELKKLWDKIPLVFGKEEEVLEKEDFIENNGVYLTVDVGSGIVGYKAKTSANLIDLSKRHHYDSKDFFEPVYANAGKLVLEKGSFYILSTKERIKIPQGYSSEIAPIDPSLSDLRSHYAGFIDPGWGGGDDKEVKGSPIVLEVRTNDHNFLIQDGQRMAKFEFVKNDSTPEKSYGTVSNNYSMQKSNRLAKYFKK